ncbi:MAG: hydroxymethylbilane synthase [Deltaproteobacteria bacterium]|nr:hydroxymethylbilane synthase [Deltaproteobacteria bacterium]MBI2229748.1 hydroxymethylbilane synthase [Deltaproteobacteria bacterium]MBI2366732.1 hydroxymethylbilane synthase [Deltaproteobacteria bacterium]MBI2531519.1 hydroxymethylbilane synthase [Deltaproteobacteria bacterium]MBI3065945.1 hydroxymethylbilane synthase [Deltaproteobacteria bacterium]
MRSIRLGSRGSTLALAQAHWVKARVEERRPESKVDLVVIKTSGDRFTDASLQAIGGKGLFTKEIEEALLRNEIDLAVHSLKDLPTEMAQGLALVAVPEREDARDVLVTRERTSLDRLPPGARIGTGSLRRRAQLLYHRPELSVVSIRGNVDTRLKKLDAGEVDALVMAAAGLKRIGREERIVEYLSSDVCVSAVAQGALGLQARANDAGNEEWSFLHHAPTAAEVTAERSFLSRLGGGCQVPVGARAMVAGDAITMIGVVASPDGKSLKRGERSGKFVDAVKLGVELAEELLRAGADRILASV